MKRTAIILLVALGAVIAVAVARASVPASDGVIYGCYGNASQPAGVRGNVTVRINATAEQCPFNYTPFEWNAQGIQGPPGPQGVSGPKGATGAQGIQGVPGKNGTNGKDGSAYAPHWEPFCDTTATSDGHTLYRHACSTFGNGAGTTIYLDQKP